MDQESELRELRRCLRDIVAMAVLPSVWTGYDAVQICNDLTDVAFRTVDADAVLLSACHSANVELMRLRDDSDGELAGALHDAAAQPIAIDSVLTAGSREFRVLSYPLGMGSDDRLVAVSSRPSFPTESERVLLRVAANQAAMWIARKTTESRLAAESEFRGAIERSSRFLAEAGELLARSLDVENTLQAVSSLAVPRIADWCFIDLIQPDGTTERVAVAHADPEDAPIAKRLPRTFAPMSTLYAASPGFDGVHTLVRNDVVPETLAAAARDEDHRSALLAMGIRAFVSVPMTSRGRTFGVITFVGTGGRTHFGTADVGLAEELARRAAMAVDNARLYQAAQEANRAKDEFLANLSHELRTPMTAILGWAHLLQIGALDENDVQLGLNTIRQSAQAQATLIDELLDVSRIVTGKLHLSTAVVAVNDAIRAAAAAIKPAADARRQEVVADIADEPLHVFGDAARLQQVIWNLLSNAVKFTPTGGTITVRLVRSGPAEVAVSVADTGEGIAPEFLPLIFERFRQVPSQSRRGGLGLGLAIAKELIELHGGTIAAESAGAGRGTTFTVKLPLHVDEEHALERETRMRGPRQRLRSLKVLLVEDDEMTRTFIDTLLRSFGADVLALSSARDARAALDTFHPDILVSDIAMPGEDGLALLSSLRSHDQRRFPAIAVTAFADATSRDRVLAAGFDGFVAKPLDPLALADEIERALAHAAWPA